MIRDVMNERNMEETARILQQLEASRSKSREAVRKVPPAVVIPDEQQTLPKDRPFSCCGQSAASFNFSI
jgi:hypothetical protein